MSLRLLCWLARITKFPKIKIEFDKDELARLFRDNVEKIKSMEIRLIKEDILRFIVDNKDTI